MSPEGTTTRHIGLPSHVHGNYFPDVVFRNFSVCDSFDILELVTINIKNFTFSSDTNNTIGE